MMRPHNTWHTWAILSAAVLVVVSCSTIPKDVEAPRVSIANLTLKDAAIFEQRFDVQLRIQNPNDVNMFGSAVEK